MITTATMDITTNEWRYSFFKKIYCLVTFGKKSNVCIEKNVISIYNTKRKYLISVRIEEEIWQRKKKIFGF